MYRAVYYSDDDKLYIDKSFYSVEECLDNSINFIQENKDVIYADYYGYDDSVSIEDARISFSLLKEEIDWLEYSKCPDCGGLMQFCTFCKSYSQSCCSDNYCGC